MIEASIPKKRTTIYIDPNIDRTFQEICAREGESKSFKIEKFMANYNAAHGKGNPQLQIINYADPNEASPHHVLCYSCKGVTRDGKVFCTNPKIVKSYEMIVEKRLRGKWIPGIQCYSCEFNRLRKK